jgi:phage terminase large subunit-like protein
MPRKPDAKPTQAGSAGAGGGGVHLSLGLAQWREWLETARLAQLPPEGAWRVWVLLGGRGAGKTRAGAEWVLGQVAGGRCRRVALVAPTFHDAREVMIEGPSGLRTISKEPLHYEPSRKRLVWPNGAEAYAFSAEDPDSLRGPQFDGAWADEFCAWPSPERVLNTLRLGLRLGSDPRLVVTSTPKPILALRKLAASPGTALTRSATKDNAANLAPGFVEAAEEIFGGTTYARQELEGEIVDSLMGALWRQEIFEKHRVAEAPIGLEIVVAVDPSASSGPNADACGIIAVGARGEGNQRRAFVLADLTIQGMSPGQWAKRAADLATNFGAQRIVAESNNGGEMVRETFLAAGASAPVRLVHASEGKRTRAEPVAALYERGAVSHVKGLDALEEQMRQFGEGVLRHSPDRVDALVWGLTDLMLQRGGAPSVRLL